MEKVNADRSLSFKKPIVSWGSSTAMTPATNWICLRWFCIQPLRRLTVRNCPSVVRKSDRFAQVTLLLTKSTCINLSFRC